MKASALVAAAILVLATAAAPAWADTVVLKDGRRVVGIAVEEKDGVVVRQKLGQVRFERADVVRIEKGDDPFSELERKRRELGSGTAAERYRLGVWCRDNGFKDEAREAFLAALALDPDHPGARAALGYEKVDGRWVAEEDRMRQKGLVRLGGVGRSQAPIWVTSAERARAETEAAAKRARAAEDARRAEQEKEARRRARLEEERNARLARLRAYEEELARARARRDAEDEAEPYGFSSTYYGPYGPWAGWGCLPRGYVATSSPSTSDILAYVATRSGRYAYPTAARPFVARTVATAPSCRGVATFRPCTASFYSGSSYYRSSFGVGIRGSWTSSNGRFRISFRSGF